MRSVCGLNQFEGSCRIQKTTFLVVYQIGGDSKNIMVFMVQDLLKKSDWDCYFCREEEVAGTSDQCPIMLPLYFVMALSEH